MKTNVSIPVQRSLVYTRKQVLKTGPLALIGGLAGCIRTGPDEVTVRVFNLHSETRTITMSVEDADGEVVVEGTATVDESESEGIGAFDPDETNGRQEYVAISELEGDRIEEEFTAGGATGTGSIQTTIHRDGEFEIELTQQ